MGSVHFWCNFLGTKKTYKIENQLLVDYSERRERDWLPTVAHPYTPDVAKKKILPSVASHHLMITAATEGEAVGR